MDPEEIKRLLIKYYEGESTGKEEQSLKKFFSQTDIPEEFSDDKEIFRYYLQSSVIPEPSSDFEKNILSELDSLDQKSENLKRRRIFGILTGIAAVMLILAGTYFFFNQKSEPSDTYSDPEIAYAETMKILYEVSSRLNHGTQALKQISQLQDETQKSLATINRSTTIIKERMKPIDNLFEVMGKISNNKKIND